MVDKLDAEFSYLNGIATRVISVLHERDRKLARKWVNKIGSYQSKSLDVARSRNDLMRNLVSVLRRELLFRVMSSKKVRDKIKGNDLKQLQKEVATYGEPGAETRVLKTVYEPEQEPTTFMSIWSPDKRTYIAAKPIGGEGALIYMAVTPHPELGWDIPDPNTFGTNFYRYPTEGCSP